MLFPSASVCRSMQSRCWMWGKSTSARTGHKLWGSWQEASRRSSLSETKLEHKQHLRKEPTFAVYVSPVSAAKILYVKIILSTAPFNRRFRDAVPCPRTCLPTWNPPGAR
jgi:hypothetical protein